MGDVIKKFRCRSGKNDKPRLLKLYFDTGSPYTFIKNSAIEGFRNVFELKPPQDFSGLGDGRFYARKLIHLEVLLLGIWCKHAAYVVDDKVLTDNEDVLVGHDFMQKFNIVISLRKKTVILDKASLKRALIVR